MFCDCEEPLDMNVPAVWKITISWSFEFLSVTDEAKDLLSSTFVCINVEIESEDEETDESWMLSSSKCPFRSKGMFLSVLSKRFEEETVRILNSLHLQMNPFSGDMNAREYNVEVEFEMRRRGVDSFETENNLVWNEVLLEFTGLI